MIGKAFRIAVWVVYLGATVWCCIALAVGVWRGAFASQGAVQPSPVPPAAEDLRACLASLEALDDELVERFRQVPVSRPGTEESRRWDAWTPGWRARLLDEAGRCRLAGGTPAEAMALRAYFDALEELHGRYTSQVLLWTREVGDHADQVRAARAAARASLTPQARP